MLLSRVICRPRCNVSVIGHYSKELHSSFQSLVFCPHVIWFSYVSAFMSKIIQNVQRWWHFNKVVTSSPRAFFFSGYITNVVRINKRLVNCTPLSCSWGRVSQHVCSWCYCGPVGKRGPNLASTYVFSSYIVYVRCLTFSESRGWKFGERWANFSVNMAHT